MKFSVISAAGVFTAVVGAKECRSNTCFRAIVSDTPDIGEAFCSSYLGREPLETVIETVTAVLDFVESRTYTISELSTTTEEITAATVTIPTSTLTAYGKRGQSSVQSLVQSSGGAQPSNPASASIVSVCKDNSVLISSICNHILPTPIAPTSTLIIEEAYTKTESVEYIVRLSISFSHGFLVCPKADHSLLGYLDRHRHHDRHGHRVCSCNPICSAHRQRRLPRPVCADMEQYH